MARLEPFLPCDANPAFVGVVQSVVEQLTGDLCKVIVEPCNIELIEQVFHEHLQPVTAIVGGDPCGDIRDTILVADCQRIVFRGVLNVVLPIPRRARQRVG